MVLIFFHFINGSDLFFPKWYWSFSILYIYIHTCIYIYIYTCMYLWFNFPHIQQFLGASKIYCVLVIIKIAEGLETLFLWAWGTRLPIIHILWGKVSHHIPKWRHGDMKCVFLIIFLIQKIITSDDPILMWLRWV